MSTITARQAKNLVEKIGLARADLTDARQTLLALEAKLIQYADETGELYVPGTFFGCKVIHTKRNTVSWRSVADEVGVPQTTIDKYTRTSTSTRVDTRALKSERIDDQK